MLLGRIRESGVFVPRVRFVDSLEKLCTMEGVRARGRFLAAQSAETPQAAQTAAMMLRG